MPDSDTLSPAQCVLLAVQYAIDGNIRALWSLTAQRFDAFNLRLTLRILLTYLPETTEPSLYTPYLHALTTGHLEQKDDGATSLDIPAVEELSEAQARKKLRHLHLLPLEKESLGGSTFTDPLVAFLVHRAHRIDATTGLLELVPELVVPFLNYSEHLSIWFISVVLPLLRLGYEYYPNSKIPRLEAFEQLSGTSAIEVLLSNTPRSATTPRAESHVGRDIRGIIGPWMCGCNARRVRIGKNIKGGAAKLDGSDAQDVLVDWDTFFAWILESSKSSLALVFAVATEWNGPGDVDLGGYDDNQIASLAPALQRRLQDRYAQLVAASIYSAEGSSLETLTMIHGLVSRLAALLNFNPPPNLSMPLESLSAVDRASFAHPLAGSAPLQHDAIFKRDNQLTCPELQTFHLLERLVFSAHALLSMHYSASIKELAKIWLNADVAEQTAVFQKVLHALVTSRKQAQEWRETRKSLLWLWSWNAGHHKSGSVQGQGIFGAMGYGTVETDILKALMKAGHYSLVATIYLEVSPEQRPVPLDEIEAITLASAMDFYDNASNGNRSRGGVKKASEIISAFASFFPSSPRFTRVETLLKATHALSFYSLTLQYGVPFQPVNIRVMDDPLQLIQKLLSQNSRSYTHLDDLISIGRNLVFSRPSTILDRKGAPEEEEEDRTDPQATERKVIAMAITAALEEDDFETAYSYVVNRLDMDPSPAGDSATEWAPPRTYGDLLKMRKVDDDVSWRAAFQAGRYQSMSSSTASVASGAQSELRRLEQRMELLSRALLLAPVNHLLEILDAWKTCEDERNVLLAQEQEAEQRFNDFADRKLPGAFDHEVRAVQPRREVGRGAVEEAPMGLFDVARGAAAAFSRSAFPLGAGAALGVRGSRNAGKDGDAASSASGRASLDQGSGSEDNGGRDGQGHRVRRRDMVASAVTGGIASGLGWVLGANPIPDSQRQ